MSFAKPFSPLAISVLVALLLGGLFLANSLLTERGAILPLDDAYIHLQYGAQAAQGHFLQYNTGDVPTTGATSLLYMLLIALGFLLGISRSAMPAVILLVGALCFALAAALVADSAKRLAVRLGLPANTTGILAGLWFAGSGWMAWSFLSGMETGWLVLFISGALWAAGHQPVLAAVCTALAALTRPEAALLAIAILVSQGVVRGDDEPDRKRRLLVALLPLLAAFVSPAINHLYAGSASATGFLAKSWFTNQPVYLDVIARQVVKTFFQLALQLVGGLSTDGHWHAFPLLQLFVVLGVLAARKDARAWQTVLAAILWSGGLLAVTCTLQTATWHHYRYQMPAYPALVVVGATGAAWLASRLGRRRRWGHAVLLIAAAAWSVHSATDFARAYARDIRTIVGMQIPLADWLRSNTPSNARVVVHDVGVIRFLGERHTIDTVGLTTAGAVDAYRNGPGALYEFFEPLRPDYYAGYPTLAPPYFGISTAPDLFGPVLFGVQLPDYSPYVSAMDTQLVTQPDWSIAARSAMPQQPSVVDPVDALFMVDSLDIANLEDERAHAYQWWNASRIPGFISDARYMAYRQDPSIALADGGRIFNGGQSFVLATQPQQAILLVGRFHQTTDVILEMQVDHEAAGEWRLPAVPGEWLESTFPIPAHLVRAHATRITFTVKSQMAETRFSPFHFWAYQGDLAAKGMPPHTPIGVDLGNVAHLIGYDLPETTLAAGDTLSLELYWRALQPSPADWHIFVHLVDPQNDTAAGIVAQWDSAPRAGTYPFWVWQKEELVVESLRLVLPLEVPPGDYVLLIGLYDLASGERAPIDRAADLGSNRLMLSRITVQSAHSTARLSQSQPGASASVWAPGACTKGEAQP